MSNTVIALSWVAFIFILVAVIHYSGAGSTGAAPALMILAKAYLSLVPVVTIIQSFVIREHRLISSAFGGMILIISIWFLFFFL